MFNHETESITTSVPAESVAYCLALKEHYKFRFFLARHRKTRLGDFTYRPGTIPAITVNANLNPFAFLVTYLHEVAHCAVFRHYKRKVAPHGPEWKAAFREILQPVLNPKVFPNDILEALKTYSHNPKATTSGDINLSEALKRHDNQSEINHKKTLRHLKEGTIFVFNGKSFIKGSLRRTRVLCTETSSNKKYTIAAHALVEEQG